MPCDTQPDELDIAIKVDRFEQATGQTVRRIVRKWAGLRTFSPSRTPAIGEDQKQRGFFWHAGQGGYGIQTAPATARCLAAIVLGRPVPADILETGVSEAELSSSIVA